MATGLSKAKWNGIPFVVHNIAENRDFSLRAFQLVYEGKLSAETILSGSRANCYLYWKSATVSGHNNQLFFGDNLPILRSLSDDQDIVGKVELIYVDPPYATNSVFQSNGSNGAYTDLLQGADYLEFIRERLIVMRELLSDTGSIYIHLDDNMAFEVKLIMDEIFGKSNFRNWITRKKCSTKNTTKKRYGNISDYILFYTKSSDYTWNRPCTEWDDAKIIKEYPCIEEGTARRFKKVPVHAPGTRNGETGKEWRGMLPPEGKHWQYMPSKLDELDANGEIFWSANNNPRRKVYFSAEKGIPLQDIWLEYRDSINQNVKGTGYPTEKNLSMLETIVAASSNPGDLVMDCFCGSGSTLQAAYDSGRDWIGIDNSIEAICATLGRFHMGIDSMGDYVTDRKEKYDFAKLLDDSCFQPTLLGVCPLVFYTQDEYRPLADDIWNSK
jgi:adenine-specific DNA-methyltransferase